jgi:hypothetical protein
MSRRFAPRIRPGLYKDKGPLGLRERFFRIVYVALIELS